MRNYSDYRIAVGRPRASLSLHVISQSRPAEFDASIDLQ